MAEENQPPTKLTSGMPPCSAIGSILPVMPNAVNDDFMQFLERNRALKREWPELVSLTVEEAEMKIKEEIPEAQIQVVQPGSRVTLEFRYTRVRLYVDSSGKIKKPPRRG